MAYRNKSRPVIAEHLGDAYKKINKWTKALNMYQIALKLKGVHIQHCNQRWRASTASTYLHNILKVFITSLCSVKSHLRHCPYKKQHHLAPFCGISICLGLWLTGCVSSSPSVPVSSGMLDARVLVKDTKQNRTYIVNIDTAMVHPDHLRMEVTTPLGFSVASLIVKQEDLSLILPRRRHVYVGKVSHLALQPVLSVVVRSTQSFGPTV